MQYIAAFYVIRNRLFLKQHGLNIYPRCSINHVFNICIFLHSCRNTLIEYTAILIFLKFHFKCYSHLALSD